MTAWFKRRKSLWTIVAVLAGAGFVVGLLILASSLLVPFDFMRGARLVGYQTEHWSHGGDVNTRTYVLGEPYPKTARAAARELREEAGWYSHKSSRTRLIIGENRRWYVETGRQFSNGDLAVYIEELPEDFGSVVIRIWREPNVFDKTVGKLFQKDASGYDH